MEFSILWDWLKDSENLNVLQFIVPIVIAVLGGLWVLYKHFSSKKSALSNHTQNNQTIATGKIKNSTVNIRQTKND